MIKLTEKDIDVVETVDGNAFLETPIQYTIKEANKLKAQILENQKIVDGIIQWYHTPVDANKIPAKDHDIRWNLLQDIVHNASGKDIKDLS